MRDGGYGTQPRVVRAFWVRGDKASHVVIEYGGLKPAGELGRLVGCCGSRTFSTEKVSRFPESSVG